MARPLFAAVTSLLIGLLVYLTSREPGHAAWIPAVPWLTGRWSFGTAGGWLPSLVHVSGFALLTAAVLPQRWERQACAGWCAIDMAFELGQQAAVAPVLAAALMPPSSTLPGSAALGRYFLNGTFDPLDLLACVAGALLATAVLSWQRSAGPRPPDRIVSRT